MINLLPAEQIIAIKSEYRRRRLVVFGVLSLAWIVILILSVLALYVLARSEHQAVDGQLAAKQKTLVGTETGGSDVGLVQLADDLKIIKAAEQMRVLPIGFLQEVLTVKPSGVKINNLLFAKGAGTGGESTIELSGIAVSRRSLLAFLERLRADKAFIAVDSPVSNLIKESNVDFNLKLHLAASHE